MYQLDISELKWKHRPGPQGDTCSISITCSVPTINVTEIKVHASDPIQIAEVIKAGFTVLESYIYPDEDLYTATLSGTVKRVQLDTVLSELGDYTLHISYEDKAESDADPNIFVYHAIDQSDPIYDKDQFASIASKYDMDTLPVDEPIALDNEEPLYESIPFYRTNKVEMDFLTATAAHRFVSIAKADVKALVQEIEDAGKYTTTTTVHI